jgi:DNA (cytosine-5)-methyltransferase 1
VERYRVALERFSVALLRWDCGVLMRAVDAVAARKLERLAAGSAPRTLELCSGCGGLSLGLATAGFELTAHVEHDEEANATYALNFAPVDQAARAAWSRPRDMVAQSMGEFVSDLRLGADPSRAFDVLAAGLPCQAFARIGRSKLRSLTGDEEAFRNDPRAQLYRRFLQIVEETRPLAIVVENVPDIMNFGGHNVPEEIAGQLEQLGYRARYTLLNAAFYGVPQLRERLFLVAFAQALGVVPEFPAPTRTMTLPRGYESSRGVARKSIDKGLSRFVPIKDACAALPRAVDVVDALADLPRIVEHLRDPLLISRRKMSDLVEYRAEIAPSPYAKAMREWPGFETSTCVSGNLVRITPRDFPIFGAMPRGADYPVALRVANELFQRRLQSEYPPARRGTARYDLLRAAVVPPYDTGKFPNKWWKLVPGMPSRTLTAHLGKDTYSHIHYDGRQRRMLSVREAARLQSFPDGFRFAGAMNTSFRQIGNAVPPLLGLALGEAIMLSLRAGAARWRAAHQQAA